MLSQMVHRWLWNWLNNWVHVITCLFERRFNHPGFSRVINIVISMIDVPLPCNNPVICPNQYSIIMKEKIDRFLACKRFAVAGVSRKNHKMGNAIYKELKINNFSVVPVNPFMEDFEGEKCYSSIKDLPADVDALVVTTKPEVSAVIIREAVERGIKNIFIQQGAQNEEILELAGNSDTNIICKECLFMFVNPKGIHKFHAWIAKIFGMYPN
jgi:uncharacterized protein